MVHPGGLIALPCFVLTCCWVQILPVTFPKPRGVSAPAPLSTRAGPATCTRCLHQIMQTHLCCPVLPTLAARLCTGGRCRQVGAAASLAQGAGGSGC